MKRGVDTPAATERGRRRRNVKLKKHLLAKMFSWPMPQQQAQTSPQRRTHLEVQDLPSRTVHNTRHHDVRNLSAGLEEMVGGRGKQSRPPALPPRGTGDHLIRHDTRPSVPPTRDS